MAAPIVAAGGAKAAERAGKALTGDIYTRTSMRTVGKGKNKREVTDTLRVNPVGIGLGAAAVAGAALAGAAALWVMQMRVGPTALTVTYGKWVWPDGSDASKVLLSTLAGTAPRKYVQVGTHIEVVPDEYTYVQVGTHVEVVPDQYEYVQVGTNPDGTPIYEQTPVYKTVIDYEQRPVYKTVKDYEWVTATWVVTETKDETRFTVQQRRGFSILGGDQPLPDVSDATRIVGLSFVSPIAPFLDWLRTR